MPHLQEEYQKVIGDCNKIMSLIKMLFVKYNGIEYQTIAFFFPVLGNATFGNAYLPSDHPSNRKRKEMAIAKLSLTIAVIFILCHSVKWIPNIHEIIMVSIMYI